MLNNNCSPCSNFRQIDHVNQHLNDEYTIQFVISQPSVVLESKFIDGHAISSQTSQNVVEESEEHDINEETIHKFLPMASISDVQ